MKTLLSLTSRRFGMTRVRVFFDRLDGHGSSENVTNNNLDYQGVIGRTRGYIAGLALAVLATTAQADQNEPTGTASTNHDPVVMAVAQQKNSGSAGNNVINPDNGSDTTLATRAGKNPESKDKVRIQLDLLLAILSKPIPPKTTEALEVLINLPSEHQAILVGEKPVGDMATNYLFDVSKNLYVAVDDLKKGTPLPTLKEVQHFLKGIALAKKLAELLKDPSITQANLLDVDDDRVIGVGGTVAISMMEELETYAMERSQLVNIALSSAEQRASSAEQRASSAEQRAIKAEKDLAGILALRKMLDGVKL